MKTGITIACILCWILLATEWFDQWRVRRKVREIEWPDIVLALKIGIGTAIPVSIIILLWKLP